MLQDPTWPAHAPVQPGSYLSQRPFWLFTACQQALLQPVSIHAAAARAVLQALASSSSMEGEELHAQIVPFTPVDCANKNKLVSSLVAVQLRIILFYLSPTPVSVCKGSSGECNSQERWLQGYTSNALQLQKGRKEEGKAQVKGVRTWKGRTGLSLLCESF